MLLLRACTCTWSLQEMNWLPHTPRRAAAVASPSVEEFATVDLNRNTCAGHFKEKQATCLAFHHPRHGFLPPLAWLRSAGRVTPCLSKIRGWLEDGAPGVTAADQGWGAVRFENGDSRLRCGARACRAGCSWRGPGKPHDAWRMDPAPVARCGGRFNGWVVAVMFRSVVVNP